MMAHLTSEEKTKGVVTCSAGMSLPASELISREPRPGSRSCGQSAWYHCDSRHACVNAFYQMA
jgi:hypothetical protein